MSGIRKKLSWGVSILGQMPVKDKVLLFAKTSYHVSLFQLVNANITILAGVCMLLSIKTKVYIDWWFWIEPYIGLQ